MYVAWEGGNEWNLTDTTRYFFRDPGTCQLPSRGKLIFEP